ncbi:TPR repeat-containing protein YrrB [mine drainage metagenome]|uniref:protein O-GlcNAc transferase n=1 Tax=mine drainage metagenome TaxID=410659 RepID=A0A1J5SY21_9ZZZZ
MSDPSANLWQQALAFSQAGRMAEAEEACRRLLAVQPGHVLARRMAGALAQSARRHAQAAEDFRIALAAQPDDADLLFQAALSLRALSRHAEAVDLLQKSIRLRPSHAESRHQLGNALRRLGRHREALPHLEEAARLAPGSAVTWLNLGVTQLELDRPAEAASSFEHALVLDPSMPEAHNVHGNALLALGRIAPAQAAFESALRLRPDYAPAIDNLARSYKAQGRVPEALPLFKRALELQPSPPSHSNLLLALHYVPGSGPAAMADEHARWDAMHAAALPALPAIPRRNPIGRRLKIGYVSADFCQHAVAFFFEPVLAHHDRSRFEVTCYHVGTTQDATTVRLRELAEHWVDAAALADDVLARQIRADGIDVLIDLAGHTAHNRLLVFARKPAPLQVTWLGYPDTTGLRAIDYRVTDAYCVPPGSPAEAGSERLLRLPEVFCCYQPPGGCPTVTPPPPAGPDRPFRFCSFNNLAKISEAAVEAWGAILRSSPDSQLLIKSPGAGDPDTQARLRARLAGHGVSEDRIEFNGDRLGIRAHLELYNRCDVALDTFPYNGTTTTCEALLMGMPVVALKGDSHVSRVSADFLSTVGLADLIADDVEQYCQIAVELASSATRLTALRTGIRGRFLASPLCNAARFTADFERSIVARFESVP